MVAITLINSFLISSVDYCNSLLVGLLVYRTNRIQAVLNDAVRLIFGRSWHDHVTPISRDSLHWLRGPQCIEFKVLLLVYKALNNLAPIYITSYCQSSSTNQHQFPLRSADEDILMCEHVNEFGKRSFAFAGPHLWNNLPNNVRQLPPVDMLKRRLKNVCLINRLGTNIM